LRVFAYIAWRYNSAAEATSLLSSVATLAIKGDAVTKKCKIKFTKSKHLGTTTKKLV